MCCGLQSKFTALHFAAQAGNMEILRFLLERGADPLLKDKVFLLLSMWLSVWLLLRCVCSSTGQGAVYSVSCSLVQRGNTPASIALVAGHKDIMAILSEAEARAKSEATLGNDVD
jgi:ankyrin repeat protein